MKVCVLQPDYADSALAYRQFDPPRNLSSLLPECEVDHLFLRKALVYKQLREAAARSYDVFVNLCEGYLDWDIPSIDVIWALERLRLPYTGPGTRLYDPSKALMKYVAYTQDVPFPAFVEAESGADCETAAAELRFPLFVKPAHAGDSLGIDTASYVTNEVELRQKCGDVIREFGKAIIEEYIDGRECTLLVAANPEDRFHPVVLTPLEFVFPQGARFKTYELKVEQHHPTCNIPLSDPELSEKLRLSAKAIFAGFEGEGYARLDFRVNAASDIFFLDINFACSVFYPEGYEGSADYILKYSEGGAAGFLRHIIGEGIQRHFSRRKVYQRRGNALSGFGIYATEQIACGQVVFRGEERCHRLTSRNHVERSWPAKDRETFGRYSVPLSKNVAILWSEDPEEWAPQNHSCNPNTAYDGLNLVALRQIPVNEELTFDYSGICDDQMLPFSCDCGAPECLKQVRGRAGQGLGAK